MVAPHFEEAAIAERDILRGIDAETSRGPVNPCGRAFEFREAANGGFVDHAVTLAIGPLGAPLFIAKSSAEAERKKNLAQRAAIGNFGFDLDAVLVPAFNLIGAGCAAGRPLVRQRPPARIAADAQNLGPGAQLAVGRVVKNVTLKAACCFEMKARDAETLGESLQVGDAKFDLGFDGHRHA